MKEEILTPEKLGLQYTDIYLTTTDNIEIHGWHIPAIGQHKGTLVFFHGNAQNISTHIASVYWLPERGYDVYLFDYRGYGRSQGSPDIKGAIIDATTVLSYVIDTLGQKDVIVFGQSLGGAIALNAVAKYKNKHMIKGLIIESSFSGFREIARDKLSDIWLTWPFQYPLSLAFTDSYDPKTAAAGISPVPLLINHGNADKIIPISHGRRIFDAALAPKIFWEIESGKHIESTSKPIIRDQMIKYMNAVIKGTVASDVNYRIKINPNEPEPANKVNIPRIND